MTATLHSSGFSKTASKAFRIARNRAFFSVIILSLLEDPAYALSIELLVGSYKNAGITKVVGTEARGFLFDAGCAWAGALVLFGT